MSEPAEQNNAKETVEDAKGRLGKQAKASSGKEDRLKAALKANMAKRKAQARARDAGKTS